MNNFAHLDRVLKPPESGQTAIKVRKPPLPVRMRNLLVWVVVLERRHSGQIFFSGQFTGFRISTQ